LTAKSRFSGKQASAKEKKLQKALFEAFLTLISGCSPTNTGVTSY
jgi:hypothetical protein